MNFESRNPATGELFGVYREHDKAQTDARANHKIKETRFRELPPSKGIRSFCSKVDNEESPTRILANTLCSADCGVMQIQSLTSATNVATSRHASTQRRVPSRNQRLNVLGSQKGVN